MKTLNFCNQNKVDFKKVQDLFILVYKKKDQVDLKLFYFKGGIIRYINHKVYKKFKIREELKKLGFTTKSRTYKHFKKKKLNTNLYDINENAKSYIIDLPEILKKQAYQGLGLIYTPLKNKDGGEKIKKLMKNIEKESKKRRREDEENIPNKRIKLDEDFKDLDKEQKIDFIFYHIKNLRLSMDQRKKLACISLNKLKFEQQRDVLDYVWDGIFRQDPKEAKKIFLDDNKALIKIF